MNSTTPSSADSVSILRTALERIMTVQISAEPEWDMYDSNSGTWKAYIQRVGGEALRATESAAIQPAGDAVYLTRFQGDADKAWTECTADAFSRAKQDQGIECRTLYATPAATSVTSAQPEACTKAPVPIDQQMARWAIDGAILKGRTGEAGPPTADHWLHEYWRIGHQLAKLGETSAWDNVTPCDTAPSEQPTLAARAPSLSLSVALSDADVQAITQYSDDLTAWARRAAAPTTVAAGQSIADDPDFWDEANSMLIDHLEYDVRQIEIASLARVVDRIIAARSPVSGQAGEADVDAINQAYANGRVAGHNEALIECAQSTAHPDLCQACNRVHKSPDCAPEDRDAVREAVSGEFPPLPPMDHIADIPNVCRVVSYSPKAMTDYAQACVLADRGIRGKASDAEDGKTDPTLDIVAWYYEVDDGDGEGFQPWTNAKRPDDDNDYVRNIRPLVFAPLAARAQQQGQGADHG